jgi:hypothetical protein
MFTTAVVVDVTENVDNVAEVYETKVCHALSLL